MCEAGSAFDAKSNVKIDLAFISSRQDTNFIVGAPTKKNIHTTHKKMQTKALYQTFFFLVFFYQDLQEDCKSC